MRQSTSLTDYEQKYILDNYEKMTLEQMVNSLSLKSCYKIHKFLVDNNLIKKRKELTEEQKDFVRTNYQQMSEPEMCQRMGIKSRFLIQRLKREDGLLKYHGNRTKKSTPKVIEGEIFNVNERWNWAV